MKKSIALLVENDSVANSFKSSIGGICGDKLSYFTLNGLNLLINAIFDNRISAVISYNTREQEINIKSIIKRLLGTHDGFTKEIIEQYPLPPCLDLNGQKAEGLVSFARVYSNTTKATSSPDSIKIGPLLQSGFLKRLKRNMALVAIDDHEERLTGIKTILSLIPEAKTKIIIPRKPVFPEIPAETEILFIEENMFFITGEQTKAHLEKIGFKGIIVSTTERERTEFRLHLKGKSKIETDESKALQFCKALNALFKARGAL